MEHGILVDPADYYFRQHLLFETGDTRLSMAQPSRLLCSNWNQGHADHFYDAYIVKEAVNKPHVFRKLFGKSDRSPPITLSTRGQRCLRR